MTMLWRVLVLSLLAFGAQAPAAGAAIGPVPDVRGQTNGDVTALAQSGDRTYLGGTFTRFGVPVGFGASLAPASGAPDYNFAKPNGTVNAVVSDGAGGWFIGGLFSAVGTVPRSRVAHVLVDGSVDPAFDPHMGSTSIAGISSGVRALARDGNTLYVGGDFNRVGTGADTVTRNFIAAIDATTGRPTSFDANLTPNTQSQFVETIAVAGSKVWAGGTLYANPLYSNLIAMDKATGTVDPISEHTRVTPGYPQVLAANDGKLYVGGAFDTVGGVARSRMAAIDATTAPSTWRSTRTSRAPSPGSSSSARRSTSAATSCRSTASPSRAAASPRWIR